jgi:hypothetical protein
MENDLRSGATEILMKLVALNSLLMTLVLAASPAVAGQKLFLSCTDGRDAQTNRPNLAYPNMNVVIDPETKTLTIPGEDGFPISHIDDQTITIEVHGNIDAQSIGFLSFVIDRVKGHLAWTQGFLTNCQAPPGQPQGQCLSTTVYDCSTSQPKPRF